MGLIDNVNVNVGGNGNIIDTLSTYVTKLLKPNIVDGKNVLTQEMMSAANTKYVIKYDYVLSEDITVPENCVLEFDGGSINGGTLIGNLYFTGNYDNKINVSIGYGSTIQTPNYRIYNNAYVSSHIEAARNNICVCENITLPNHNTELFTSIYALNKKTQITFNERSNIGLFLKSDGLSIRNITLTKVIGLEPEGYPFRRECVRADGVSDINIENCIINGALAFQANDTTGLVQPKNVIVRDNSINADFTNIADTEEYKTKDVLTFIGYDDIVIDNNNINATNVNRVLKTTSFCNDEYNVIYARCGNVNFTNNIINATCTQGKQVYDAYFATGDIAISNNIFNCRGFSMLFENKTIPSESITDNPVFVFTNNVVDLDFPVMYISEPMSVSKVCSNVIKSEYTENTPGFVFKNNSLIIIDDNLISVHGDSNKKPTLMDTMLSEEAIIKNNKIDGSVIILKKAKVSDNEFTPTKEYCVRIQDDGNVSLTHNKSTMDVPLIHMVSTVTSLEIDTYNYNKIIYLENKQQSNVEDILSKTKGIGLSWTTSSNNIIKTPETIAYDSIAAYLAGTVNTKTLLLKENNKYVEIVWKNGKFIEADGAIANVNRNGIFASKPSASDIYVGFKYFCTDRQTTEGATDGIEIIHKGNDVWVDALGRVVS